MCVSDVACGVWLESLSSLVESGPEVFRLLWDVILKFLGYVCIYIYIYIYICTYISDAV